MSVLSLLKLFEQYRVQEAHDTIFQAKLAQLSAQGNAKAMREAERSIKGAAGIDGSDDAGDIEGLKAAARKGFK